MASRFNSLRQGVDGRAVHDIGGLDFGVIDREERDPALWEQRVDAMMRLLSSPERRGHTVDAMRRMIESYAQQEYDSTGYFDKWVRALRNILLEQEVIEGAELEAKIEEVRRKFRAEGRRVEDGSVPIDTYQTQDAAQ